MKTLWWIEDENGALVDTGRVAADEFNEDLGAWACGIPNPQRTRREVLPLLWPGERPVKVRIVKQQSEVNRGG